MYCKCFWLFKAKQNKTKPKDRLAENRAKDT